MNGMLAGQVVLVTGAGSGIGAATARSFAEVKAEVALLDRDETALSAVAGELREGGYVVSQWVCDVADERAVAHAVRAAAEQHRRLDHAVLCAGILYNGLVSEMPLAEWQRTLAVNLTGSFLVAREAVRLMLSWGRGGTVTFLSSEAGKHGAAYGGAYCASKFGVLGLMESLASEVTGQGI